MRAVFLTLLSANLLFLGWSLWIDTPREAGSADTVSQLPRLQLVTEAPPPPKPTAGIARKMVFREEAAPAQCTSLGPFKDLAGASRAAGVLTQKGLHLRQRAEQGETIEGFWVYVGGMQSDEEVSRVADRLDKTGFKDAHVMKGSANRRISVGMFTTRERAERRAAAVRQLGLEPGIGERKFQGTVYWIDVDSPPGTAPEYSFVDVDDRKVGLQSCPPDVRPIEPETPVPADDYDGITKSLPRTTVASAPKTVP